VRSPWFGEQVRLLAPADGVRLVLNVPGDLRPDAPTRVVFFATPNGNTIEQTLGCRAAPGLDWHYDIQHVAAQIRKLREIAPEENIVLACLEAEGLSWPSWRARHGGGGAGVRAIVARALEAVHIEDARIDLCAHILRDSTPMRELYLAFPLHVESPRFRFEAVNSVIDPPLLA